jgi:clathrin heavy chain
MIAGLIPAKPEAAIALAQTLCDLGATVGIEKAVVFDAFMSANVPTALTTVALYVLREDKPDDAEIQTKVIEYNIAKGYANVAESIVSSGLFSQFNKNVRSPFASWKKQTLTDASH